MVEITTLSEVTIDGKLSLGATASSKGLFDFYGDDLRAWFHAQRAAHDAIMVGAGTVLSDDTELTVRHAPGPNPLRIVPIVHGRAATRRKTFERRPSDGPRRLPLREGSRYRSAQKQAQCRSGVMWRTPSRPPRLDEYSRCSRDQKHDRRRRKSPAAQPARGAFGPPDSHKT